MKFLILDKWMSAAKDYHLPIMVLMFIAGIPVAWFGHLDMAFVAFTGTIVSGITGHAFSKAWQKDDSDVPSGSDSPPASDSK